MEDGLIVVLDVGKTLAKLSLWTRQGEQLAKITRVNRPADSGGYRTLDVEGIRLWLASALSVLGRKGPIDAIVPVGHGAAAVIVRGGEALCLPIDYEESVPAAERARYDAQRDPFVTTGSPALPDGLNLGVQLHCLEARNPDLFRGDSQILLWPQYWAWVLSGVAASEVTSLGCHSDLWKPASASPSDLARRRRWSRHLPPLRPARDVLGTLLPDWAERTGLSASVRIHCGIHDSNAALLAARGFPELHRKEATVVSTGTWFVAMRTLAPGHKFDIARLESGRDCLMNVDAEGRLVPSARFMGGREIEQLTGIDSRRIDIKPDQAALLDAVSDVVAGGTMVLPTYAPGFGPFANGSGRWVNRPDSWRHHSTRAAASLYAALVTDVMLDLVGARERILIEGRFAEAQVFVRALASLRPQDAVYASSAHNDVSFGALRLLVPELAPAGDLERIRPLEINLNDYRLLWRREAERVDAAA